MTQIWHKVFDQERYWAYLGQEHFVYSFIFILKRVVDERLINQRGVWDGSSEVRCKTGFRMGKSLGREGSEFYC